MTKMTTAAGIGKRIQAIRKARGFTTARDLANSVPDGRLSESVLQNIEAGRKPDLSVSQLLNISAALRISPLFLLVPLGRPLDMVDLPNLSSDIGSMSVAEFDNWVAGQTWGPYRAKVDEASERAQLEAARELTNIHLELERLKRSVTIETARRERFGESDEQQKVRRSFDTTSTRLRDLENRFHELEDLLLDAGWFKE